MFLPALLIVFLYVIAAVLGVTAAQGDLDNPLTYVAAIMAGSTAYGATILLRSLLAVLREDRRK